MLRQAFFTFLCFFGMIYTASAAEIDHKAEYADCMQLVNTHPNRAFDKAITWKTLGGGEAAEHCIATALIKLESYRLGAARLEELANTSRRTKEFKAQILMQAAQGWILAKQTDRARQVLSTALSLSPDDPEIYVERAQVRADLGGLNEAVEDLNEALKRAPDHLEALIFRATALRLLEKPDLAQHDLTRALQLAPHAPAALLEQGMIHRINGNTTAARDFWVKTIEQDEGGVYADLAQRNLAKMDVNN